MTWTTIKAGVTFRHSRFLTEDLQPILCTVTAVRKGQVYWTFSSDYDAGNRRGAFKFPVGAWSGHVAQDK
jgi:hypothetical protein